MKYIVYSKLTEESIRELRCYEELNLKLFKSSKQISNFYIPLFSFHHENYSKIKNSITKKLVKINTFRVNINSIKKDSNKHVYLLIEQKGFLNTIRRTFEEELSEIQNSNFEILTKNDNFYIDFMNVTKYNQHNIVFPQYLKVGSIDIMKWCYKKNNLIDSIKFKKI